MNEIQIIEPNVKRQVSICMYIQDAKIVVK